METWKKNTLTASSRKKAVSVKIVIGMPNWVGDAVLALPTLGTLRAAYPEAEIWVAARDWVKELFAPGHSVRGVIPLPQVRDLKSLREAVRRIRVHKFDIAILLTNSFSSALVFRLAGVKERWATRGTAGGSC